MSLYDELRGVAKGLLKEFAQGVLTLDVYSDGGGPAYDPKPPVYTPQKFSGTVRGTTEQERAEYGVAVDLVVTVPGDLVPKTQDRMTIDDVSYQIVKVEAMPAAGTTVAWAVFVRK